MNLHSSATFIVIFLFNFSITGFAQDAAKEAQNPLANIVFRFKTTPVLAMVTTTKREIL